MTASPICTYVYKYLLLLLHFGISLFVALVSCSKWKYQWVLGENLKCFLTQKEDQPLLCMMGGFSSHPLLLLPLCDSLAQILHVILNVIYMWEGVSCFVCLIFVTNQLFGFDLVNYFVIEVEIMILSSVNCFWG